MGYFSNGTEGTMYQERFCEECIHDDPANDKFCPIWGIHLLMNYDECNNPDSILHMIIPRSESGAGNEQCVMFVSEHGEDKPFDMTDADRKYAAWKREQTPPINGTPES